MEWGQASLSHPAGQVSGDLYVVRSFRDGLLVGVVDGLGHGPDAAAASRLCAALLEERAGQPLIESMNACHERLQGTRGAALSLASFNLRDATLSWVGVGNVAAVLVSAAVPARLRAAATPPPGREFLLLRSGVVGGRLPRLTDKTIRLMDGDTLVMATDGIRGDFSLGLDTLDTPQEIARRVLKRHATGKDDALVVVVRYTEADRATIPA